MKISHMLAICFDAVTTTSGGRVCTEYRFERCGLGGDCVLQEPAEEDAAASRPPPVEPEGELV